ncbi:glycosyltransferase [Pseudomonas sp. BF-R-19]|uniref:glycosyltransferase n=1 Tax=Pseudomonas sp. BF-R-19 TaxID=2832397 RepID=UPI001CBC61C1|nr:glycosyltransferase [Pseudomonas sp. BF-R-19]
MTINILFVCRDRMPLWRVDISVLFGKYMRSLGWKFSWFAIGDRHKPTWMLNDQSTSVKKWKTPLGLYLAERYRDLLAVISIVKTAPDIVVVRDDYFSMLLIGAICKLKKIPCVYWMSFLMEEGYIQLGYQRKGLGGLLRRIYGRTYRQLGKIALYLPTHVIVQSEKMQERIFQEKLYLRESTVMHMAADIQATATIQPTPTNIEFLNIGYSGSISCLRGFEEVFKSVKLLQRKNIKINLHLVGWYETIIDQIRLENLLQELSISADVIMHGRKSWEESCATMAGCDVCISPIPENILYDVASPTKIFEYMALGKPVIATQHSYQDQLIAESGAGWSCALESKQLASTIMEISMLKDELKEIGQLGYEFICKKHTYQQRAIALDSFFRTLIKDKPQPQNPSN